MTMDDECSAANRALIHRVTRPRAKRRTAHHSYAALLRLGYEPRIAAVEELAARIRKEAPGVSYAKEWSNTSGDVLRVYVAFGPLPVERAWCEHYLDLKFGDVRANNGNRRLDGDDGGPVDAIIKAWSAWAGRARRQAPPPDDL